MGFAIAVGQTNAVLAEGALQLREVHLRIEIE